MDEKEAIELLGKLKSFMENTNKQIETLICKTHNLEVDINKLKKLMVDKNRIIVAS